jgi:hypothetical protein
MEKGRERVLKEIGLVLAEALADDVEDVHRGVGHGVCSLECGWSSTPR